MYFIVPPSAPLSSPEQPTVETPSLPSRLNLNAEPVASYYPKRTPQACDRCRLKKARCSAGRGACTKCKRDGVVCVTSAPTKSDVKLNNPEYVKMVESQRDLLVEALHKIWKSSHGNANAEQELNAMLEEISADRKHASSRTSYEVGPILKNAAHHGNTDGHRPTKAFNFNGDTTHPIPVVGNSTPVSTKLFTPSNDAPSAPPQSDDLIPTFDQDAFENWCPEWIQSSLEAMPDFNASLDQTTIESMAQSPRLTWENWIEFCDQEGLESGMDVSPDHQSSSLRDTIA